MQLNQATPVLSAGLYSNAGLPSTAAPTYGSLDAISSTATIEFLQLNGLDGLVDGYSIHSYPSNVAGTSVADRVDDLTANAFAICAKTKPCWLTEWGFVTQVTPCPIGTDASVDSVNYGLVSVMRQAFEQFAASPGALAEALVYSWGSASYNIYGTFASCDGGVGLTRSGGLAITPL
jgi:hypothetical protein